MTLGGKSWYFGLAVGALIALCVAVPSTILDWRLNPGGLFHDDTGTHWAVVVDTLFSWMWPVFLLAAPVAIALHAWATRRSRAGASQVR